ncbi:hypothetical protein ACJX0J_021288, partial [Zea mays]
MKRCINSLSEHLLNVVKKTLYILQEHFENLSLSNMPIDCGTLVVSYCLTTQLNIENFNKKREKVTMSPLKIKMFLWFLRRGVILTKDNLANKEEKTNESNLLSIFALVLTTEVCLDFMLSLKRKRLDNQTNNWRGVRGPFHVA